jgi:transposase
MRDDAPQRDYPLRELFNALRYVVKTGCQWRFLPHDFPPWTAVYQQARRWLQAGVFEAIVHDLRVLVRLVCQREPEPSAIILDGRTLQSTPESGARAGYDGHKKRRGSKIHMAVDTLGNLLALHVTPANEQERAQVTALAAKVQEVTGDHVEVAFVDQGYEMMERQSNGKYRLIKHPNWGIQQPSKPTFSGKVFLINGKSFSTTSEFLSHAHARKRATFIGEESGGGYYGNTSGPGSILRLPHTKLQAYVPLMTYYMAVQGYKAASHGVVPDHPVKYTIEELLEGMDKERAVALDLARKTQ